MEHGRGAGKDIYSRQCNAWGKTFPRSQRVRPHAKCEHNVWVDWASSNYSYCRHHPAAPHRTQFALYSSTLTRRVRLHVSLIGCMRGAHYKHVVSSRPTALPRLYHSGFSRQSRASRDNQSSDSRSNGDQRCSAAVYWLLCRSLIINQFYRFDNGGVVEVGTG